MRILLLPLLFFSLGALIVFFVGPALEFPESYADFLTWLESFEQWAWLAGSLMIIGDAVLPLPSDPTIFSFGLLYGGLLGGFIGGTAATIAGLLGYGLARLLGERGALFLVGEKDLGKTRSFYDSWGFAAVALGRAIGGPAEYLVVVAGLTHMPFVKVLSAILTGAYSAAFCISFLGAYSRINPILAVLLAIALVLSLMGLFKLILRRHESRLLQ